MPTVRKTAETVEAKLAPMVQEITGFYKNTNGEICVPEIKNNEGYVNCADLSRAVKAKMAQVDEGYDDLIASANKLHKDLIGKKKVYWQPLKNLFDAIERRLSQWRYKLEEARKQEELRLQEEARKEEQSRLLHEASNLEKAGHTEEAQQVMQEALETPAPLVVAPSRLPKVDGVFSRNLPWRFEIIDQAKVRDEYWTPDLDAIGAVVKAKGELAENLIGRGSIRVYRESKTVVRG